MPFTSPAFLIFVPALLLLYYLLPRRTQPAILLLAGLLFYGAAGWQNLLVLASLVAVTWLSARRLHSLKARETVTLTSHREEWDVNVRRTFRNRSRHRRAVLLFGSCGLLITLLIVAKWTPCLRDLPSAGWTDSLIVPLGLSFTTLQAISYLADLNADTVTEKPSVLRIVLYLSYFPGLLMGPISRYGELTPQLLDSHRPDFERFTSGLLRVLWGYAKKGIVADTVATATLSLASTDLPLASTGAGTLALLVLYTVQIYADFTGGIDIALGVSELFGVTLPENFDHPFAARSVKEYWRRWHMTMSRFFTDYVFYPLSASRPMQWLSRRARARFGSAIGRRVPLWLAILATWALTGLWHGFGWNFLVWGLCNGVFMLLSQEFAPLRRRLSEKFPRAASSRITALFACVGTLFTVGLFRTLDVYGNVPRALTQWGKLFTFRGFAAFFEADALVGIGLSPAQWILILSGVLVMLAVSRVRDLRARLAKRPIVSALVAAALTVAILIFGNYGLAYRPIDFIYSQF